MHSKETALSELKMARDSVEEAVRRLQMGVTEEYLETSTSILGRDAPAGRIVIHPSEGDPFEVIFWVRTSHDDCFVVVAQVGAEEYVMACSYEHQATLQRPVPDTRLYYRVTHPSEF